MQLSQLDAWMRVAISLIPSLVLLAGAIIVVRRQRQWITIVMVATAALNVPLPVAMALTQGTINQMKVEIQSQKTQAEAQQLLTKYSPELQNYSTLLNWLNQALFFSTLVFAVTLFMTLRLLLAKAGIDALAAQPAASSGTSAGNAPDATC
jgi:hypothetical protein